MSSVVFVVKNVSFENVYLFKQKVIYLVRAEIKQTSNTLAEKYGAIIPTVDLTKFKSKQCRHFLMKCKVFR